MARTLKQFFHEEDGAVYLSTAFLMSTLVIAIPLGFMFLFMYEGLVEGARQSNLILGMF